MMLYLPKINFETQSIETLTANVINRYPIKERMQSIIKDMRFPNCDTVAYAKSNVQNPPTVPNVPAKRLQSILPRFGNKIYYSEINIKSN